jgi:LCP family protein required for cell wall assembly
MSAFPERPPRVGRRQLGRAGLAALLVVLASAAAVTVTVVREVQSLAEPFVRPGRTLATIPEIDRAEAGGPRTIMILGSDARLGVDKGSPTRSDTILLVRADPDKEAIAVMSIPRDLSVTIPGVGQSKINYAYEKGQARLVVRTVKKLFEDATGEPFAINNVMTIGYGGFRRAVNYIGGVYVDIDRDYFNDNSAGENYATIDVNPGYRKLRGRDALDYVRYRHGDNDLVRAARQQDFLRQAKNAGGLKELLNVSDRERLTQVFSRYFQVDEGFKSTRELFSMLRLALYLASEQTKLNEVRFTVREAPNPQVNSNLYASRRDLRKIHGEFMNTEASAAPRQTVEASDEERDAERPRRKRERGPVPGLEDTEREGEDMAVVADPKLELPFYFPAQRLAGSSYVDGSPRIYTLRDEQRGRHEAYRLVLQAPGIGEYYGVQGMTWKAPPILDNPDRRVRRDGRTFQLFFDGSRLRLVAWKTKRGVYWVTNTLTQSIGKDQMLAMAASLRRLGQ